MNLLDLPPEILVKILEQDGFTLEDRLSLRATCSSMRNLIASTDWRASITSLYIQQKLSPTPSLALSLKMKTVNDSRAVPPTFFQYLFRSCRLSTIYLRHFNFKSDADVSVNDLEGLSKTLACTAIRIEIDDQNYNPRLFDVLKNIKIGKYFSINCNDIIIRKTRLLELPPVSCFKVRSTNPLIVDGPTLLALLKKQRSLFIDVEGLQIYSDTLVEAKRFIDESGHYLSVIVDVKVIEQTLKCFGVFKKGRELISKNEEANVLIVDIYEEKYHRIQIGETAIAIHSKYTEESACPSVHMVIHSKSLTRNEGI